MIQSDRNTLLILIPGFPKNEQDSTCLPAQQQFVLTFNKIFPEISLIILSFQYPFAAGEYDWHGNRVIAFGGKNKGGIARFLLREKIKSTLNNLKEQTNLTGAISFWCGETALLGNHFSKKHYIPHYNWIMGQDAKVNNTYVKKIKPFPAELIAISDSIQDLFNSNHGIRPQHVIPLGICSDQELSNSQARDIDILCAGSLIPLKGFDQAIDIIGSIQRNYPSLKALICGSGPEQKKLQSKISQGKLSDTITMTGELPYEQLMQQMSRSRILLHPSIYEGFSGVCLEALSNGMEVVSYCKPMTEHIPHWHIVQSPNELFEMTSSLLESKKTYEPSVPFDMAETVKTIGRLFDLA